MPPSVTLELTSRELQVIEHALLLLETSLYNQARPGGVPVKYQWDRQEDAPYYVEVKLLADHISKKVPE